MFKIQAQDYGYKIIFSGVITAIEMKRWLALSEKILENHAPEFCLFIDASEMIQIDNDSKALLEKGIDLFNSNGLIRAAIVASNPAIQMQFKHIAIRIGSFKKERYIETARFQNWEQVSLDWIENGTDPNTQSQKIQLSKLKF